MTYPHTGLQRILAGSTDPVLRATLYDQDGAVDTANVTATCTITRADGTVVATSRTATDTSGVLTCSLTTAEATTLDVLRADWIVSGTVRTTTWHRTVGAFIYTLADLDAMPGLGGLDAVKLRTERDRISDIIERATHAAWWPQYDVETKQIHCRQVIVTRHRPLRAVRSLIIEDVSYPLDDDDDVDINAEAGTFDLDYTVSGLATIGIEHGFSGPTQALRDAALIASTDRLLRKASTITGRARSVTNDMGITQSFGWAGPNHPTGIDEVDAIILAHDQSDPSVF